MACQNRMGSRVRQLGNSTSIPGEHCLGLPKRVDFFFPFAENALGLLGPLGAHLNAALGLRVMTKLTHVIMTAASKPLRKL